MTAQNTEVDQMRKLYIEKSNMISKLINAIPKSGYSVNYGFTDIEWMIEKYADSYGGFVENPDFQRGHVWSREQQISYIEAIFRGLVSTSGLTITLNCPDFQRYEKAKDSDLNGVIVMDGLQRLTAIRQFVKGEFKVFNDIIDGGADHKYFDKSAFSLKSMIGITVNMFNFQYKKEVLNYYLLINSGGTVHTKDELDRVKAMYNEL